MVSVLFHTESHFPVNRKKIKEAIESALPSGSHDKIEVSVSVVGDRQMRRLNADFRKKDETTDVLSFPLNDPTTRQAPFADSPDGVFRLGDIVVSYPEAIEEAAQEGVLVDDKIVSLVLHGLKHLLGEHHKE
ncbi:rRNA maturation RNase YbeY [Patescibacteria group bacterium]|nr:rRNA maturation RNase YbeY [Patescibacteria group bacterium]MBU1472891.1 rRNA maturation RNase YbeY [Patescibacteria group bacterium]MBU2459792.1 rRNA maturation RNase YbeY [Patescibacteria group bacterium]MBU2544813.1 rRNA maturation RNase YbeY [Patescibacteria group bacterium]